MSEASASSGAHTRQSLAPSSAELDLGSTAKSIDRLRQEVGKIVIGQSVVIDQMLTALISRGHCLLIGVPGLAKTVMAKALADALDMQFKRVQFTPDLMPSDITGTNVLQEDPTTGKKTFSFLQGPVFTNVLLADEINRTPPKTQASLLEAMQEHRVTSGGEIRALPQPFFVLATQNPLEQEGTYPLPEAQLDRFMFSVIVTYPSHAEENAIVAATTERKRTTLTKILTAADVVRMQKIVRDAPTPPKIVQYAVNLARATRPGDPSAPDFIKSYVDTGAGPRAGQYLVLAAKARAILSGRHTAEIDDVRAAAVPVLRHRMFTNFTALSENISSDELVQRLVKTVPDPGDVKPIVYSPPAASDTPPVQLTDASTPLEIIREMKAVTQRIRAEVQQTIVGQADVVDLILTALLAGGHCLLVGVPGLAKTTLVSTLAEVLELDFKRVQFTPDLMPSDITGTDIMEVDEATRQRQFRFVPGPVFTNLLLADEINRTPPKTQASLLEAMQELSVTSGNTTYQLKPPFFVLATQNPLEQEGTYPLPEAQLDRFMFNIHLDYPAEKEEPIIIDRTTGKGGRKPKKVIGAAEIVRLQQVVRQVPISRHVLTYVTTLVRATRPQTKGAPEVITKYVHCGAGPRAAQNLVLGAKARAVMHGRANVSIADVKAVAVPVLRHRVFTNFTADAEGMTPMSIVEQLIKAVPEPRIDEQKALAGERPSPAAEVSASTVTSAVPPSERKRRPEPPAKVAAAPAAEPEPATEVEVEAEPAVEPAPDVLATNCPSCGNEIQFNRSALGRRAKCKECGTVFALTE